eukprot:PhM_4_TR18862/c6_g3_i1/m.93437
MLSLSVAVGSSDDLDKGFTDAHNRLQCDIDEITPNLFLGSLRGARNVRAVVSERDVRYILNISRETVMFPSHVSVLSVDLRDTDRHDAGKLCETFRCCDDFMRRALDENNGRVLVFCRKGISRSAAVVAAYLMRTRRLAWEDALDLVQERRACVSPNWYFLRHLYCYERAGFDWAAAAREFDELVAGFEQVLHGTRWETRHASSTSAGAGLLQQQHHNDSSDAASYDDLVMSNSNSSNHNNKTGDCLLQRQQHLRCAHCDDCATMVSDDRDINEDEDGDEDVDNKSEEDFFSRS